jgi:hypothetical protein
MCVETYAAASKKAWWGDLWCYTTFQSCATACLLSLTSEGWHGAEAFNIVSDQIAWEGGVDPESRFNGEMSGSLELVRHSWGGKVDLLDEKYWTEEGEKGRRRGFWTTDKAHELLGWTHKG